MQSPAIPRPARRFLAAAAGALFVLSAGLAQGATAHDKLDQGVRVGATIPHQLEAMDQTGTQRSFRTLRGKKGLILMFSRSFDW